MSDTDPLAIISPDTLMTHLVDFVDAPLYNYYPVTADSFPEFLRNVSQVMMQRALGYEGLTRHLLAWGPFGTSFKARMTLVIDLPQCDTNDDDTLHHLEALRCHEDRHVQINVDIFRRTMERLQQDLPLPYRECDARMTQMHREQEEAHARFDQETDYGRALNNHCPIIVISQQYPTF